VTTNVDAHEISFNVRTAGMTLSTIFDAAYPGYYRIALKMME